MRAIDADELKYHIKIFNIGCGCSEDYQKSFLNAIDEQPTIEPEPKWIPTSKKPDPDLPEEEMSGYFLVTLHTYGNIGDAMEQGKWMGSSGA